MEINITRDKNYVRVSLMGHFFDQDDFEKLKKDVQELIIESKNIIIDISRITFLSSRGLGTFITLSRLCQEQDLNFILFCPREEILDTIQISGIDLVVSIADTEEKILTMI